MQNKSGELLAAHGQTLCGMEQIIGDEIARVFRRFRLRDGVHHIEQELPGNEVGENAGDDFRQRKRAFERKTEFKGDVYDICVKQFL